MYELQFVISISANEYANIYDIYFIHKLFTTTNLKTAHDVEKSIKNCFIINKHVQWRSQTLRMDYKCKLRDNAKWRKRVIHP